MFSDVGGRLPTVWEAEVPRLDTVAFTSMVIIPSPDTHPRILKISPDAISRVTPVKVVLPSSFTSTSW